MVHKWNIMSTFVSATHENYERIKRRWIKAFAWNAQVHCVVGQVNDRHSLKNQLEAGKRPSVKRFHPTLSRRSALPASSATFSVTSNNTKFSRGRVINNITHQEAKMMIKQSFLRARTSQYNNRGVLNSTNYRFLLLQVRINSARKYYGVLWAIANFVTTTTLLVKVTLIDSSNWKKNTYNNQRHYTPIIFR